jgi:hypothetical protein
MRMSMTLEDRRRLKGSGGGDGAEPFAAPIPEALRLSGLSRSGLYRAAGEGRVVFFKHGRSTLVDMASLRTFVASLPRADIKTAA